MPGRAHGLRKLDATRAANNRATINELQALFGWTDVKMPMLYTRAADRQRLSVEAIDKLGVRESDANEFWNIYSRTFGGGAGENGKT